MKAVDGVTIRQALHMPASGFQEAMARDLFALGCKIHAEGHEEAGRKTVWTALQGTAAASMTVQRRIVNSLPGNEAAYAEEARAHCELLHYLEAELQGFAR